MRLSDSEWEWWIGSLATVLQHGLIAGTLLASLVGAGLLFVVGYWETSRGLVPWFRST